MKEAIKLIDVCKSYGKAEIIHKASFSINEGEVCGIVGANGSGKTTIMGLATGLIKKNSGQVLIGGYDIDKEYTKAIKNIGMCFDKFLHYENLTGYENIKLIYNLCKEDCYSVNEVLEMVGLSKEANKKVHQYSSGMKQRLAVARTILKKPKLIILDEPINALDHRGMKELYDLISTFSKMGTAFLISSHMLYDVEKHCTNIIFLNKGNVQLSGNIKELTQNKNIEEIYLELC